MAAARARVGSIPISTRARSVSSFTDMAKMFRKQSGNEYAKGKREIVRLDTQRSNIFSPSQTHFPRLSFVLSQIFTSLHIAGPSTHPVIPFYCAVCSLPTEYCEFGTSVSKCRSWLEEEDKAEYGRLWGEGTSRSPDARSSPIGSLAARMGTLSVEKQEKLEADAVKAEKKAEKKAEAEAKKKDVRWTCSSP